jgi:hypothetical protein
MESTVLVYYKAQWDATQGMTQRKCIDNSIINSR